MIIKYVRHIKNLWGHVSLGANSRILRYVCLSRGLSVCHSQTKVSDDATAVGPHQNVL